MGYTSETVQQQNTDSKWTLSGHFLYYILVCSGHVGEHNPEKWIETGLVLGWILVFNQFFN